MDDDHVGGVFDAISLDEILDASSRLVHERLRERNDQQLGVDAALRDKCSLSARFQLFAVAVSEDLDDLGTNVVSRSVVAIARVPQADNQ